MPNVVDSFGREDALHVALGGARRGEQVLARAVAALGQRARVLIPS